MIKNIVISLLLILSIEGVKGQKEKPLSLKMADSAYDLLEASQRHDKEAQLWDSTYKVMWSRANAMPDGMEKVNLLRNAILFQMKGMRLHEHAFNEINQVNSLIIRALKQQKKERAVKEFKTSSTWKHTSIQFDVFWYSLALSVYPSLSSAGGTEKSNVSISK